MYLESGRKAAHLGAPEHAERCFIEAEARIALAGSAYIWRLSFLEHCCSRLAAQILANFIRSRWEDSGAPARYLGIPPELCAAYSCGLATTESAGKLSGWSRGAVGQHPGRTNSAHWTLVIVCRTRPPPGRPNLTPAKTKPTAQPASDRLSGRQRGTLVKTRPASGSARRGLSVWAQYVCASH